VSLFENELTQCSTVQENHIQMKESAAGRCKELVSTFRTW
jgi:3-methyladenine DNA glycosylase AlkD